MIGKPLILASQSLARRTMLQNAGLDFEIKPSGVDEAQLIKNLQEEGFSAPGIALELAKAKALDVSGLNPDELVVGADQTLEFNGNLMVKAKTPENACEKLHALKGETHSLISAVCVARNNNILWTHIDDASLSMKDLDNEFFNWYCNNAGEALTRTVGAYELEGLGGWLFSSVKGDFFTILGMPLLPLITYLYEHHGIKPSAASYRV